MRKLSYLLIFVTLALTGCGDKNDDLRDWMKTQGDNLRGKIEPIPELQPYEPFTFAAANVIDPFKPRKVDIGRANSTKAPDSNRRKEALEAFPLEKIRMVGTLQQTKDLIGLVRTEDNRVFQVKRGNYVGQNFGVVMSISDTEINLRELLQDGAGEWIERMTRIGLTEAKSSEVGKK